MKLFKSILILMLFFGLGLTACVKDNEDVTTVVEHDPVETVNTTTNNLLTNIRTSGDDGLQLDCITILYTFEMLTEDGTELSITSDDDFLMIFEDSSNVIVDFVYPLDVLNADDEEVAVNNAVELGELFISCVPDTGWVNGYDLVPAFLLEESCFDIQYPVELIDEQQTVHIANSLEEFIDLVSTNDILFFNWPLHLIDEDDEVYTANNADEFFELMYSCEEYDNPCDSSWYENDSLFYGLEYLGCYQIVFPLSVLGEDGEIIELADADAMMNLIFNGGNFFEFVYPFQLIGLDGNVITVLDEAHLNELMEECWDDPFTGSGEDIMLFFLSTAAMGDDACYSVNYPITVEAWDSSYTTIHSDIEFAEYMGSNEFFVLQYPVSVTFLDDGSVYTLDESEDILYLLENCEDDWTGSGDNTILFFFSGAAMGEDACYDISYPISVELMDSSTMVIDSDLAFIDLVETFQFFWIQYPVTVILNDGSASEAILNDDEDLFELIDDCQG